ncbi:hypothetical protein D5S18_14485 [Nocardia panacis]|uniref:Uncharacterized protein n=1 Tax=Nocardia panacis TaxID=2340916 RepID=A0A3A4KHR7_9NOCA|nr:hypothetical protein D5S18_14485 [Nocardia panacis]
MHVLAPLGGGRSELPNDSSPGTFVVEYSAAPRIERVADSSRAVGPVRAVQRVPAAGFACIESMTIVADTFDP